MYRRRAEKLAPSGYAPPTAAAPTGREAARQAAAYHERAHEDPCVTVAPCAPATADVVLATEVLYTEAGTRLFVGALCRWMEKPDGACYLVNNVRRTNFAAFEALCEGHGLRVERLANLEGSGGAELSAAFLAPWDDATSTSSPTSS